jgi:hypothetical protein
MQLNSLNILKMIENGKLKLNYLLSMRNRLELPYSNIFDCYTLKNENNFTKLKNQLIEFFV